ncbi:MAG: hypothetical protein NPIRA02_15380 [Nitrospirales bacterium]|nr:MAG: hypothetical protein NPIRA02_15380 [Nitrospirales bacterium]
MSTPLSTLSHLYNQFLTSVTPRRATIIVIAMLGFLGAAGWLYISDKEQYLIQRNFRMLNLWSEEIVQKTHSYQKILDITMDGLLADLEQNIEKSQLQNDRDQNRQLWVRSTKGEEQQGEQLADLPIEFPMTCSKTFTDPSLTSPPKKESQAAFGRRVDIVREFQRLCEAEGLTKIDFKAITSEVGEAGKTVKLEVLSRQSPPLIKLTHVITKSQPSTESNSATPKRWEISVIINLKPFLNRMRNNRIFDDVILFEGQKKDNDSTTTQNPTLIYHSGTRELTWQRLEDIEQQKPHQTFFNILIGGPDTSTHDGTLEAGTHQFSIAVPGHAYQVFTRTILLPGEEALRWTLVGLVENEKFLNSYLAISSTVLLAVMIGLMALVLAIPLFHLKMMGPTDSLRSTHVLGLILSALLGTGLLTFVVLDLSIYIEGKEELQERLKQSAQSIKNHVHQELKSVLSTLERFDQSQYVDADFANVTESDAAGLTAVGNRKVLLDENIQETFNAQRLQPPYMLIADGDGISNSESSEHQDTTTIDEDNVQEQQDYYRDFLYAFWMDPEGSLRINWSRDTFDGKAMYGTTQNLYLAERNYVQSVTDPSIPLWKFPKNGKPDEEPYAFFLEPIISWTTGRNTVVASMPSRLHLENSPHWIAAIEFTLKSLMDKVVLPPGTGFAVIDSEHRVLFHSEEWRNLREQFLVETDHNSSLHALLSAKTAGHTEGSYWGKANSFYVLPLHSVPWSLIVFRDMEILRSVNLVGLLVAGSLYGLWSLVVYGCFWIFLNVQTKHRKAPWLWPKRAHHALYVRILGINLIAFSICIICSIALAKHSGAQLLAALVLPAPIILGNVLYSMHVHTASSQPHRTSEHRQPAWWSYPRSYSLMMASFLLILGVVPAMGCFTSVFNQEMKLFTQFQLLELFDRYKDSGKDLSLLHDHHRPLPAGVYPNFFLDVDRKNHSDSKPETFQEHSIFEQIFGFVSQPFIPLLKQTPLWGFVGDSWPRLTAQDDIPSSNPLRCGKNTCKEIRWGIDNDQVTLHFYETPESNKTTASIRLSANIPLRRWFAKGETPSIDYLMPGKTLSYLLAIGLCIVWLIKMPRFIADRTLFLSYTPPPAWSISDSFVQRNLRVLPHCLLVGFPGQGKTTHVKELSKKEPAMLYFDFKAHRPEEWERTLKKELAAVQTEKRCSIHVIFDHLDVMWKDPVMNTKKLELLEKWVYRSLATHDMKETHKKHTPKEIGIEVRDTGKPESAQI